MTGGGSGGHITPILAVASELKRLRPDIRIVYIGQKGDTLADIPAQHPAIDKVYVVSAGKFRRYHGKGWHQIFAISVQLKNLRDVFRVVSGTWQSYRLLRKLQPSVIFSRGGFVSVPVAIGGKLNHIPYITHDSDSVPSLANRLIARWASLHAVALPKELYPYPAVKTVMVGVPLSSEYQRVTPDLKARYRHELGIADYQQILLITGGGNGAKVLNGAVVANAAYLLKRYSKLLIIHVAGRSLQQAVVTAYDQAVTDPTARQRVQIKGFATDFYRLSGAADVVIARGGATNLAEFAVQGKACIIVPAAYLVGGHQVKNAQALAEQQAIIVMSDEQAAQERRLALTVSELLDDDLKRQELEERLASFALGDATEKLAQLVLGQAKTENPKQP